MPELHGVKFSDKQFLMLTQVLETARNLAGPDCVYGVTGQASKREVRAALVPGRNNGKGSGVFLMIANTGKSIAIRRPSQFTTGQHIQQLTLDTLSSILTDVVSWHGEVLARSSHRLPARNLAWTRDELILALDLYFRVPPWTMNASHPAILELSETLNHLSATDRRDAERYRNVNGTYMKLMNLEYRDPTRDGKGLKGGGQLEAEVWEEFGEDREKLSRIAATIRAAVADGSTFARELNDVGPVDASEEAVEGGILTRLHRLRERNQKIVKAKKSQVMNSTGKLACEACSFDFAAAYGELGAGYIECHHVRPLAELTVEATTKLSDLALVCGNCHRMLHRRKPWLTIPGLRAVRMNLPLGEVLRHAD